jgi:hypothetical protein
MVFLSRMAEIRQSGASNYSGRAPQVTPGLETGILSVHSCAD